MALDPLDNAESTRIPPPTDRQDKLRRTLDDVGAVTDTIGGVLGELFGVVGGRRNQVPLAPATDGTLIVLLGVGLAGAILYSGGGK